MVLMRPSFTSFIIFVKPGRSIVFPVIFREELDRIALCLCPPPEVRLLTGRVLTPALAHPHVDGDAHGLEPVVC